MTALEAIQQSTVEGTVVKLPGIQLDRKTYLTVKKKMELIGGKWKGGKTAGFVFASDPTDLLQSVANGDNRNLKKEYQFFATPPDLADELVELAEIDTYHTILEPSAGQGALIEAIGRLPYRTVPVVCYEAMGTNRDILATKAKKGLSHILLGNDFLEHDTIYFDRIIANPPFSRNQDIDHIRKMYEFLNPGGRLVSLSSQSWTFGPQKKQVAFRDWFFEVNAEIIPVGDQRFKSSGTLVSANIIIINKY